MARTVKDAAYLLHAIAGKDPYDNYTFAIPFKIIPDYVAACKFSALKGKRLGVPRNLMDVTNDATATPIIPVFNAALKLLEAAGAIIVENTNFTGVRYPYYLVLMIAIFTLSFVQTFSIGSELASLLIQFLLFHWLCNSANLAQDH